jgi:S-adenosylmethionine synthetase
MSVRASSVCASSCVQYIGDIFNLLANNIDLGCVCVFSKLLSFHVEQSQHMWH